MAEKRSAAGPALQPAAKTIKLAEFCKASAYYGSRKGYVFKTGDKGLGYYLDNVAAAKQRVVQGHDGPGLFANIASVAVETPDGTVIAEAQEPLSRKPAELPDKPRPKAAFDPYADLPAPASTAPARKPPPKAQEEEHKPVRVFAPGLFKLEQVRCLHIVRKHRDSRNPTSWRNPAKRIERSREDASDELRRMRAKIMEAPAHRRKALFGEYAKAKSDCSSAKKLGDLGVFKRGKMSKPFEDAAFSLEVGEMSKTVASSSGVHLILRVA
mmetsp:Transcript_26509/g.79489  ORF Transcript_26509/g.79489 Transcript_26509/m.79489 type:complete len:269 (-) Transcript_26509:24-830(-)